jgi:DNA-binding PadR family transcriptional regulator
VTNGAGDISPDEARVLFHLNRLKDQGWVPVAPEVLDTRLGSEPDPATMLATLVDRGYVERVIRSSGGSYELTDAGLAALAAITSTD